MTSLEVHELTVHFDGRPIVENLSIVVPSGAFAAVLGPSGCGKTTFLRSIAGLITPSSGTIRFGKQLVSISSLVLPPNKRHIGYVPQEGGLFPHLNVAENIGFGVSKNEKIDVVDEMLDLVGLKNLATRKPYQLSGGQQTRVALARALAIKPQIVLLDEPFGALDAALRNELREEVCNLLKERKTTALMVTHDREEALVSADIVALMRHGQILQYGSSRNVYSNPISPEIAVSTGDVLLLKAERDASKSIRFALSQIDLKGEIELGQLVIRPEEIIVSPEPSAASLSAIVTKVDYYGHDAVLQLLLDSWPDEEITARIAGPLGFSLGQKLWVKHAGPIRWFELPHKK
jgi:iron(III) transport system ATP-binding protein